MEVKIKVETQWVERWKVTYAHYKVVQSGSTLTSCIIKILHDYINFSPQWALFTIFERSLVMKHLNWKNQAGSTYNFKKYPEKTKTNSAVSPAIFL